MDITLGAGSAGFRHSHRETGCNVCRRAALSLEGRYAEDATDAAERLSRELDREPNDGPNIEALRSGGNALAMVLKHERRAAHG